MYPGLGGPEVKKVSRDDNIPRIADHVRTAMGGKPSEIHEAVVLEKHVPAAAKLCLGAVLKARAVLIGDGLEHSREPCTAHAMVPAMDDQLPLATVREGATAGPPELAGDPSCTPP
jgi:hypothetical protein